MVTDLLDLDLHSVPYSTIIGTKWQCANAYSRTRFQEAIIGLLLNCGRDAGIAPLLLLPILF
jgi:hypothetical protein